MRSNTRTRHWRRCNRLLEGTQHGLPKKSLSALLGAQDGQCAQQPAKTMQPNVKAALQGYLERRNPGKNSPQAFDGTIKRFSAKYAKAMECLAKDRDEMLAFYDLPAEH